MPDMTLNMGRRKAAKTAEAVEKQEGRQGLHTEPERPYPYPHRLSVDVTDETYQALRLLALERNCRLVELVRSAIAHELARASTT
jgi:hypothetical protein